MCRYLEMRKFVMVIMLASVTLGCQRADPGLEVQRSRGLRTDAKAEVAVLDNLDQYRKTYGLRPLKRNCALSQLAANWVQEHPEDDTYEQVSVSRGLRGIEWRTMGLTMRVKPTASEAWEQMLVQPTDFANLKHPRVTDVGVAVEHEGDQTWVYFITIEKRTVVQAGLGGV
jgi:Cysteine-rich secretory protein family